MTISTSPPKNAFANRVVGRWDGDVKLGCDRGDAEEADESSGLRVVCIEGKTVRLDLRPSDDSSSAVIMPSVIDGAVNPDSVPKANLSSLAEVDPIT